MSMDRIERLSALNQISLSEEERDLVRAFFAARAEDADVLAAAPLAGVRETVHVMPVEASLREDEVCVSFSREEMQRDAIHTDAGYFCVPRVLD